MIIKGVFEGISHLHGIGICHRDIKIDNVYLKDGSHCPKIIDFNSAIRLKEDETTIGSAGDPRYQAPEIVE